MNKCLLPFIFIIYIAIYAVSNYIRAYFTLPPPPVLDERAWWGVGEPIEDNGDIRPFKLHVSQTVIDDLHRKLKRAIDFQPPMVGTQQQYGINTHNLKNIINFWLNDYKWRKRENIINTYPQYLTKIQGLNIHFVHVKPKENIPKNIKIRPLLLLHGWPSSVREFYDLISILTTPMVGRGFVFEVIAPSLPGFTFSEAASKPGLGSNEMAVIFKILMDRLGFPKYYVQGGDWGGNIAQIMTTLYGEKILGMHSNFCFVNTNYAIFKLLMGSYFPKVVLSPEDDKNQIYPLREKLAKLIPELGYMHVQATYPDTLGVALRDSPAGLAAYMLEKYSIWTDPKFKNLVDGGLTKKFKLEDLLDNVMIYWITGSITTSMRLYAESFTWKYFEMHVSSHPTTVPSACARFKNDLIYQPKKILQDKFLRLFQLSDLDGGHFAHLEIPNVLAEDIFKFVQKVEQYLIWEVANQQEQKMGNNERVKLKGEWEKEKKHRVTQFKMEL